MPAAPLVVFTSRPNSHPFQERHISCQDPIKIGRSVARYHPAPTNAIFDCKVLSRNHALLWFEDNKVSIYGISSGPKVLMFICRQASRYLCMNIIMEFVKYNAGLRMGQYDHCCISEAIQSKQMSPHPLWLYSFNTGLCRVIFVYRCQLTSVIYFVT